MMDLTKKMKKESLVIYLIRGSFSYYCTNIYKNNNKDKQNLSMIKMDILSVKFDSIRIEKSGYP